MCSWISFYIPLTSQLQEAIPEWAKVTSKEMNEVCLPLCLLSCHQKQMPLSHVDDVKQRCALDSVAPAVAVAMLMGINISVMGKGIGTQLL